MIVVRLVGGLGNQLFQYAAGRTLANIHKTELLLDLAWYDNIKRNDTTRQYDLKNFKINAALMNNSQKIWAKLNNGRLLKKINFMPKKWKTYKEISYEYDENFINYPNNIYLDGYWQSYKYFLNDFDSIRNDLKLKVSMGEDDSRIISMVNDCNSVSVHIRRGDYVTNAAAKATHGLCSMDYYNSASNLIYDKLDKPHFFIFSDDPVWARNNLRVPGPMKFVSHNNSVNAYKDLVIMSFCKNHIIANSSFSWWGAWLNTNATKVVIAPKRWFLKNVNTETLMPSDWIRV